MLVVLISHSIVLIYIVNRRLGLSVGQKVRVHGLKAGSHYNGQVGVVEEQAGVRWVVELMLETGLKKLKIKAENLQVIAAY